MGDQKVNLEELMRQASAGDRLAYAALLRRTSQMLRPFLKRRLSHASEAEDVLQEILISIHKARHTYDGKRPYEPWMYAIARYRLQDYLRTHYRDELREAVEISEIDLAQDVTEPALSYESIRGEIEKLPDKQATILQMMHEEGYTSKEVAERIGMKESAVKVAAHRAYKMLRKILDR